MSAAGLMRVDAQVGAPQPTTGEHVRFEGVAITPGVYQAEGDLEIQITEAHLEAIAAQLSHVQIRDLHEEAIEATVGEVKQAHLAEDAVTFVGEVARDPHATVVRRFPDSIRFSLGFRFSAEDLDVEDGAAELPDSFYIDHVAIVGRGQDPDARLTRLLNQARPPDGDTTMDNDDALAELRRQRDEAIQDKDEIKANLAEREERLETMNDELELAKSQTQEAKAELTQAREHFADTILKLELRAGEDVNLTERRNELLGMDLGELDELRLELAEQAANETQEEETPATKAGEPGQDAGKGLDLSELSIEDTVRLGLMKEVL